MGTSARITAYCGAAHTSCTGTDSAGTLNTVLFEQYEMSLVNTVLVKSVYTAANKQPTVASRLVLTIPAIDGSGVTTPITDGTMIMCVCMCVCMLVFLRLIAVE